MDTKVRKETEVERLNRLGMKSVAGDIEKKRMMKRKLAVASEFYRIVRPEKIAIFQKKLEDESIGETTEDNTPTLLETKTLVFTKLEDYGTLPPPHVLDSLETAQERKCFDRFEVAHIVKVADPILFGRVDGCNDRFFVDQWDDDVSIDDLIAKNEG